MNKLFNKILIVLVFMLSVSFLSGCGFFGKDTFSDYESGQKIILTTDNYATFIDLYKGNLKVVTDDDGMYNGIKYKFSTDGYSAFSYFNVIIKITLSVDALNNVGDYQELSYTFTLKLDHTGSSFDKSELETKVLFRNFKNLTWQVSSVSGYIVKK